MADPSGKKKTKSKFIRVRITEEQELRFRAAAKKAGAKNFSRWVVDRLESIAKLTR